MTTPKTRVDEGTTDFERELLGLWGHDEPSPRVLRQVLGLAATGSALGVTSTAAAAGATTVAGFAAPRAALGLLGIGKWLAIGAVIGTSAAIVAPRALGPVWVPARVATSTPAVALRVPAPPERSTEAPAVAAPPSSSSDAVATLTGSATPANSRTVSVASAPSKPLWRADGLTAADPNPNPPPEASGNASARASRELGDQVRSMDRARDALASGDAATSRRILDDYEARYPDGILLQEATLLRIEVLVEQGDHAGARALAARFFAAHPTSPHAARIRRLLDGGP